MRSALPRTIALLVTMATAGACLADAESTVREMLTASGLKEGYDGRQKRMVVLGVSIKEVKSPSGAPDFDKIRSDLSKVAVLDAKKELMFQLSSRVSGEDVFSSKTIGENTTRLTASVMKQFSKMDLRGCTVLCSAESWEDGAFQVAVALGWSEKSAERANKALSDSEVLNVVALDDEDPEWCEWCEKNDLSAMVGCRRFTDKAGNSRHVGIAATSIEGLSGAKLKSAICRANRNALGHLAFMLYSDSAARTVATRYLKEICAGDSERSVSWAQFTAEVVSRCKPSIMAHEVYSKTVKYPLTGEKMYVSVCGVAVK